MFRTFRKLRVLEEQIVRVMQRGMLDSLTSVDFSSIPKILRDICYHVSAGAHDNKWSQFIRYFTNTWMTKFDFELWNVSKHTMNENDLVSRTNNALENFNRKLNSEFASPHPNIFHFIDVIKEISCRTVRKIMDLKSWNSKKPER
jgi:hypothetical protein